MSRSLSVMFIVCMMAAVGTYGCKAHQFGHFVNDNAKDMVGSHDAGAATYNELVEQSVGQLLARQAEHAIELNGDTLVPSKRICFVGIENRSSEELGDFKDQLFEQIDLAISSSGIFQSVSSRFVQEGLRQTRAMPGELMIPDRMREFQAVMEQAGQPFDYLVFATLTSGTTQNNSSYQRDYLMTLEMVNVKTGQFDKETAKIRKGYHKTRVGKWTKYNPFR